METTTVGPLGITRSYHRHQPSGGVYVLEFDGDAIVGVAGPLHHTEVRDVDDHVTTDEDAEWAAQQCWGPPIEVVR